MGEFRVVNYCRAPVSEVRVSDCELRVECLNRTGLVGGPIQREDGTHGTTQ